ncbi:MAG: hypothetical protein Q4D54_02725 [Eubacteriales bacterium]|nr:hypothetical protein [Eubacteriales bacterium]
MNFKAADCEDIAVCRRRCIRESCVSCKMRFDACDKLGWVKRFRNILLHVSEKNNNAHRSMEVVGISYEKPATMNAQFIINSVENYDGMTYGYEEGNVIQEYVCSDGSTACFIQHPDYAKK